MITILELPIEIQSLILQQLSYSDLVSLAKTNTDFYNLLANITTFYTDSNDTQQQPLVFKEIPFGVLRSIEEPQILTCTTAGGIVFIEIRDFSRASFSRLQTSMNPIATTHIAVTHDHDYFNGSVEILFAGGGIMGRYVHEALKQIKPTTEFLEEEPLLKNAHIHLPLFTAFGFVGHVSPDKYRLPGLETLIVIKPTLGLCEKRMDYPNLKNLAIIPEQYEGRWDDSRKILDKMDFNAYLTDRFTFSYEHLGFAERYGTLTDLAFSKLENSASFGSMGELSNISFPLLKNLRINLYFSDHISKCKAPVLSNIVAPNLETFHLGFNLGIYPNIKNIQIPDSCRFTLTDSFQRPVVERLAQVQLPAVGRWAEVQPPVNQNLDLSFITWKELHLTGSLVSLGKIPPHIERLKLTIHTADIATHNLSSQVELSALRQLCIYNAFNKMIKVGFLPAPALEELKVIGLTTKTKTIYEICDHYRGLVKLNIEVNAIKETDKKPKSSVTTEFGKLKELVIWTKCADFNRLSKLFARFTFPKLESIKICFHSVKSGQRDFTISFKAIPTLKNLNFGVLFPKKANLHIHDVKNLQVLKIAKTMENITITATPRLKKIVIHDQEVELQHEADRDKIIKSKLEEHIQFMNESSKKRLRQMSWHATPTYYSEGDFDWSWDKHPI